MKKYAIVLPLMIMAMVMVSGCTSTYGKDVSSATKPVVKEFYTNSFFTIENGKPHPQFSLKNITVNKGDTVRIYVNVTKGTHDFNIDEFNVHAMTPTGNVTAIEFMADKAGEFVYYCSMPGHRQNGHWGTLTVLDGGNK